MSAGGGMRAVAGVLALSIGVAAAHANPPPIPAGIRLRMWDTTVVVLPSHCSGVIVGAPWLVATAKHCVDAGMRLRVRVGKVEQDAELIDEDEAADQVLLALSTESKVRPLRVARRLPIVGTVLYFLGNRERPPRRWQAARLDRIAPCANLPSLPRALHTSIDGRPGDSGAPLVDGAGEVVGLVHGGAGCRIATPGDRLARLVDRALLRQHVRVGGTPLNASGRSASPAS